MRCGRLQAECAPSAASGCLVPSRSSPKLGSGEPGEARCGLCRRLEPPYVKATAYGSYESGLRELIHLLKYNQVRPAANVLGRMLSEAIEDLQPLFAGSEVLVVPVPLHSRKLRQRGFNQSELIARAALEAEILAWFATKCGFVGALSRNQISDRAFSPPAPGKYSGGICGGQAR